MIRCILALAVLAFVAVQPVGSVRAQAAPPENPRERLESLSLDDLYTGLRTTKGPNAARIYEAEIQKRLNRSGSATADLLLSWAVEAMGTNDHQLALDVLDQAILLRPDFAEAWNKRATVHFILKDFGGSLSDLRHALKLQPRHFGALAGLGTILEDLGREDEAISAYRRALDLNPRMESVRESLEKLEKVAAGRSI